MKEKPLIVNVTQVNRGCFSGCGTIILWIFLILLISGVIGVMKDKLKKEKQLPTAATLSPALTATSAPQRVSPQKITLQNPITVKTQYGAITLPAGHEMQIVSRTADTLIVTWNGQNYSIPAQ